MKKIVTLCMCLSLFTGCSSNNEWHKMDLSYKVYPKVDEMKYDYNFGIAKYIDERDAEFVLNQDDYFAKDLKETMHEMLYQEIRATQAFTTVKKIEDGIPFLPSSLQIQAIRTSTGRDAILIPQINKLNVGLRKLSDGDDSEFRRLKLFMQINYKVILTDSESVMYSETIDTSESRVVKFDDNLYTDINHLVFHNMKKNIGQAVQGILNRAKVTKK